MQRSFVKKALEEAKKSFNLGEVPVGCIIWDHQENRIIATTHNKMMSFKNPTYHAEMLAITAACEAEQRLRLEHCDIYVTLEPCPMCAQAISHARFRRLYFGAYDPKSGGVEHGPRIFDHGSAHHVPEIYGGIEEEKCAALLKQFFVDKRG